MTKSLSEQFKRTRSRKVELGDIFMLPLLDGRYVFGQVIDRWLLKIICVAIFDCVIDHLPDNIPDTFGTVISLTSVSAREIRGAYWKKIGNAPVQIDVRLAPHTQFKDNKFIGASFNSGKMIEDLANAFYGLSTWEPYPGHPNRLRELLLSQPAGKTIH